MMSKLGRPLVMSAQQRRQQIYLAAEALFLEQGYAKVTMNDIAAQAGMSKKTLYLYFADKKQLLSALISQQTADLPQAVTPTLEPIAALKQHLFEIAQNVLSERHLKLCRLAIAERLNVEGLTASFYSMGVMRSRNRLLESVARIEKQDWVLELSVEIVTDMLFGASINKCFVDALMLDIDLDFAQIEHDIHASVDALFIKK